MEISRLSVMVLLFFSLIFIGCATVHQPPGVDSDKMIKFHAPEDTVAESGSAQTSFQFDLSIEEAITAVTYACYELEIPLYYPLLKEDKHEALLVSGPIVARCGVDCDCSASGWGWGPAADVASGTISIKIHDSPSVDKDQILVEISSMFFRTESTGGEYSSTNNVYFKSLGRIEKLILKQLSEVQYKKNSTR